MSIRQFSGDYIAMANSTLQLAGWDQFFPSGQTTFGNSSTELAEEHFYKGEWIGIRAVEDTWLFVDSDQDNHNFNSSSMETIRDTNKWDSDQAKIMISAGDIVYGNFTKVKILEGHALGIREDVKESPAYNVIPNSSGYYNPEDFPGCIARYDFGGLVNDTTNSYGTVNSLAIERVKNLSTYTNSAGQSVPDIVDINTRKSVTVSKPTLNVNSALTGKTVSAFAQANRQAMFIEELDSNQIRLMYRGSPLTFVVVQKSSLSSAVADDWGNHLFATGKGPGTASAGSFAIAQYVTNSNLAKLWGMNSNESSAIDNVGNAGTGWQVNIFQAWDQNDNSGSWYTSRCSIFEDTPTQGADVHNKGVFNSGRSGDGWIDLSLGFSSSTFNIGTATAASWTSAATHEFYDGYIGEILIYNKPLCLFERTKIMDYLNNKWGT
jgi:hypothetical protein